MTGKLIGQLFVTGSVAAALGLAPAAALAQTAGGAFSTSPFSCLTTSLAACPVDQHQNNSVNSGALGFGFQSSVATGGNGSINISAPTQTVNAQAATNSFNGAHDVAVGTHHFVARGDSGSFVALPVGGASNTGGAAPAGG